MSQFDAKVRAESRLYARYMDDIVCEIKPQNTQAKLEQINKFHPALQFTMEREKDGSLPFLDMKIVNSNGKLSSTWYHKPTDTGLIMNFHSLAPKRYKRSVVSGFVHRIYRACSSWQNIHESIEKAKRVLEQNQYPPEFYGPIINQTLTNIFEDRKLNKGPTKKESDTKDTFMLFLQYRGKCSEAYARALHRINAPCRIVFTLRKLKTIMPSLKPPVEKMLKSGVVYQLECPRCNSCYVGQTSRHLQSRFREHINNSGPVKHHLTKCDAKLSEENVSILGSTNKGEMHLLTLEALWIRELQPTINTKDEYRSRTLTIKL